MRLILPVVLMLPTLVQAETVLDLPYLQSAETRFGTLSVGPVQLDGYDGKQLLLDGQPIDGPPSDRSGCATTWARIQSHLGWSVVSTLP